MRLNEISRAEVVTWVNYLGQEKNQKKDTVRSNLTVLKDALETATYELEYLEKNVASKVKIPNKSEPERLNFYTKNQLDTLLTFLSRYKMGRYSHSIQYYVLFTLLSRTGLRLGEALALEWSDIDLTTNILSVNKSLSYDDHNNANITSPKSKSSVRKIKIDNNTALLLKKT